MANMFDY